MPAPTAPLAGLPSVRVTDMRQSGALTLDMAGIAVTRPRDDGAPVSTEVGVVRFRMRSGSVFLHLRAWWSALKSFGCIHAGSILCWRRTGLRFWREGRFAALGIGRAAQGGVVPP
jgi:hypothetical protein